MITYKSVLGSTVGWPVYSGADQNESRSMVCTLRGSVAEPPGARPPDCGSARYNSQDMQLIPGSRLDSFEILALLGKGGMGEVYRARDMSLKRDVAIKVLLFTRDIGTQEIYALDVKWP